ncbi:hypothetical protein GDO81_009343, partial [Engystomops pustulosus]
MTSLKRAACNYSYGYTVVVTLSVCLHSGIMWAAGHLIARARQTCVLCNLRRSFASKGEDRITQVLKTRFPLASSVRVVDISGGCGAMYEIHIESEEFKEKRTVQQHQMVNE